MERFAFAPGQASSSKTGNLLEDHPAYKPVEWFALDASQGSDLPLAVVLQGLSPRTETFKLSLKVPRLMPNRTRAFSLLETTLLSQLTW